jgi:hypothetical protein
MHHTLQQSQRDIRKLLRRFERDELTHGFLAEDKTAHLEQAKQSVEKLHTHVSVLADALQLEPMAPLCLDAEADEVDEEADGFGISVYSADSNATAHSLTHGPFSDDETRSLLPTHTHTHACAQRCDDPGHCAERSIKICLTCSSPCQRCCSDSVRVKPLR